MESYEKKVDTDVQLQNQEHKTSDTEKRALEPQKVYSQKFVWTVISVAFFTGIIFMAIWDRSCLLPGQPGNIGCILSVIRKGALTGPIALTFTMMNGIVVVLWFLSFFFGSRRSYKKLTKYPTMIGMLGTLFSLMSNDLTNPEELASNFSVAIVSSVVGIFVYLFLSIMDMILSKSFKAHDNE